MKKGRGQAISRPACNFVNDKISCLGSYQHNYNIERSTVPCYFKTEDCVVLVLDLKACEKLGEIIKLPSYSTAALDIRSQLHNLRNNPWPKMFQRWLDDLLLAHHHIAVHINQEAVFAPKNRIARPHSNC